MKRFLEHCETYRNLSPHTIRLYKQILKDIKKVIGHDDAEKINLKDIQKYVQFLKDKNVSFTTIKIHLVVIKMIFNYLRKRGVNCLESDMIDLPKIPQKQREICELEDLDKVFSQITGDRDRAIFEVLRSSGMRINEVVNLTLKDIKDILKDKEVIKDTNSKGHSKGHKGQITVVGKGGKVRLVFVSDLAVDLIQKYLDNKREHLRNSSYVFNGLTGNKHITTEIVGKVIREAGKKVGVKITPHMIRHVFATNLLSRGCDIGDVQKLLGHSSLNTTSIYLHRTNEQLKESWRRVYG